MKWEMNYKLDSSCKELDIKRFEDISDIRFNINSHDEGFNLSGFTIYVDGDLTEDDAKFIAQVKANIIFDYLTGIHGIPIMIPCTVSRASTMSSFPVKSMSAGFPGVIRQSSRVSA